MIIWKVICIPLSEKVTIKTSILSRVFKQFKDYGSKRRTKMMLKDSARLISRVKRLEKIGLVF